MDLQGADSKVQSSSALPFRGDGMNYVQDKNYRATINDAKPALDLHDNGKVDKASRNAVGTETILYNTISQLRTTVHGIPILLILKSFCGDLCLVFIPFKFSWHWVAEFESKERNFTWFFLYFIFYKILLSEPTNIEEEEVWKMIQECLDLRKRYVFTEKVAPWMKEAEPETNISEMRSDPFHFVPVEASKVSYFPIINCT